MNSVVPVLHTVTFLIQIFDCSLTNSSLENCCVDGTAFNDTKLSSVNMNGCSYDEQEWSQKTNEMTLSM